MIDGKPAPARAAGTPAGGRPSAVLSILALCAATALPGCIRRYPAPEEPADADTPYSAFAALHRITPPAGPEGTALPNKAFRLAISLDGWLADTMLVEGKAGRISEGRGDPEAALAILGDGLEPVVVLVDAARLGEPALCELVTMLGARARLATGAMAFGRDAAAPRQEDGVSLDPLGGVSGDHACAGSAVD